MKRLITDITKIAKVSEPLQFIEGNNVKKDEGLDIVDNIKKVMESKNLVALSAPQIGIYKRIFCIKFSDGIRSFIDPIITKKSGSNIIIETFANLPNKEILLARPTEIRAVYYTDEFKYEDNKFLGSVAALFDQQCQVLDGILPCDIGLVSDIEEDGEWKDATEEEMKQAIEIYKQFIETKKKSIMDNISEDEKKAYKKLKFTEDVINSRIQVVNDDNQCVPQNRQERRMAEKNIKKATQKYLKRK